MPSLWTFCTLEIELPAALFQERAHIEEKRQGEESKPSKMCEIETKETEGPDKNGERGKKPENLRK